MRLLMKLGWRQFSHLPSWPHSSSRSRVLSLDGDTAAVPTARQNGTNIQTIITTGDTPQLDHGTIQQPALPTGHVASAQIISPGKVMAVSSMATAKGKSVWSSNLPIFNKKPLKLLSADPGRGRWCYTTGWNSSCRDLQRSQRYPNNPWSYEACNNHATKTDGRGILIGVSH